MDEFAHKKVKVKINGRLQYNAPMEEYNPMTIKPIGKLTVQEEDARNELKYEWIAKYKDGSELRQYNDKAGLVHHFGHIDQEKIVEFILESKTEPKFTVSVNLLTGLFYINNKPVKKLQVENTHVPLGLFFGNKKVVSSWGNKAKLISFRHVEREYNMGLGTVNVKMTYELGYEAEIDGKHEKHTIVIDERGHFGIPMTPEQEGFKAL